MKDLKDMADWELDQLAQEIEKERRARRAATRHFRVNAEGRMEPAIRRDR